MIFLGGITLDWPWLNPGMSRLVTRGEYGRRAMEVRYVSPMASHDLDYIAK